MPNLPPSISQADPRAPWNEPSRPTCEECGAVAGAPARFHDPDCSKSDAPPAPIRRAEEARHRMEEA